MRLRAGTLIPTRSSPKGQLAQPGTKSISQADLPVLQGGSAMPALRAVARARLRRLGRCYRRRKAFYPAPVD
jgi:hypothetical protein